MNQWYCTVNYFTNLLNLLNEGAVFVLVVLFVLRLAFKNPKRFQSLIVSFLINEINVAVGCIFEVWYRLSFYFAYFASILFIIPRG